MIMLYAERISITMNLASIVLKQFLSPNVTFIFIVSRGEIESPMNPVSEEVIGVKSLVDILSFQKESK